MGKSNQLSLASYITNPKYLYSSHSHDNTTTVLFLFQSTYFGSVIESKLEGWNCYLNWHTYSCALLRKQTKICPQTEVRKQNWGKLRILENYNKQHIYGLLINLGKIHFQLTYRRKARYIYIYITMIRYLNICAINLCNKLVWPTIKHNALLAKTVGQSIQLNSFCDCQGVRERG